MSLALVKRKLPYIDVALFQMELIAGELPLVSDIAGLHFVTRQGARLFPCLDKDGKVEKYAAFMVSGDENALPADVGLNGEAFTFGTTHGIAIVFRPPAYDSGLPSQVDDVCQQIADAIKKLKQHIAVACTSADADAESKNTPIAQRATGQPVNSQAKAAPKLRGVMMRAYSD